MSPRRPAARALLPLPPAPRGAGRAEARERGSYQYLEIVKSSRHYLVKPRQDMKYIVFIPSGEKRLLFHGLCRRLDL
jgi:hypothetical protein